MRSVLRRSPTSRPFHPLSLIITAFTVLHEFLEKLIQHSRRLHYRPQ
ncbi:MAG: hypothetical protein AAGA67_10445 [Cyanobacteria bacterium P01_F01_bin.153]